MFNVGWLSFRRDARLSNASPGGSSVASSGAMTESRTDGLRIKVPRRLANQFSGNRRAKERRRRVAPWNLETSRSAPQEVGSRLRDSRWSSSISTA